MLTIGCDFHTRFQQIAMVDTTTGEMIERRLEHENGEAQKFYATLPGPARVGMEATINAQWFEKTLHANHHELWVGDPAEIRARWCESKKPTRAMPYTSWIYSSRIDSRGSGFPHRPSVTFGRCCGIGIN